MGKRSGKLTPRRFVIYVLVVLMGLLGLVCLYNGSVIVSGITTKDDAFDFGGTILEELNVLDLVPLSIPICDIMYSELIPCLDRNLTQQLKLKLNYSYMEHYERHCPPQEHRFNCLIPPPSGYKIPIRWPESKDEVWKTNIPHTHLASIKSDQNWMVVNGEKINFPGGGTHFHHGADKYIASLARMLKFPDAKLHNGGNVRNVLDIGCGVASFGAYLLSHKILAMSLAPNDVHENQIQFALERGIPSTLGVLGTKRLPYPSRSFELAHCSRCRIDWLQRDGILLLEVDRLLRPGGYFAYSSPEAYAHDPENLRIWNAMHDMVRRMCWKIAAKKNQTVIWVKPLTNSCYLKREPGTKPPVCNHEDDFDRAWNTNMQACISPYSESIHKSQGSGLAPWPQRLTTAPPRLRELRLTPEEFHEDTRIWQLRVDDYWKQMKTVVRKNYFRNVMDMNSNLGGFAAALKDIDLWVMNVAPVNVSSRLKIIYDRGLIGTTHDWCESFSTYPRTYDLLHSWKVFSEMEERGCAIEDLLLEMDRILRPEGFVIIRDKRSIVNYIRKFLTPLKWDRWSSDFEPKNDTFSLPDERVLIARKRLWTDEPSAS